MGAYSSEDYLDDLLNSVDGMDNSNQQHNTQEENKKIMGNKTENDFLKEFESELESEAYDDYISDFENELEGNSDVTVGMDEEDLFKMADDDASLDDMLAHMEENISSGEVTEVSKTMDTDDPNMSSLEELDSAVGAFEPEVEATDESVAFENDGVEEETVLSEEKDAELSDILGVESLQEVGEGLSEVGLESETENLLDGLEGLDIGVPVVDEVVEPEEEKKKKGGFLEKLKLIFFGEDEEEDLEVDNIELTKEEKAQIAAEKKAKKQEEKEKKKKEKEQAKQEKEKEKKEKPPKPPKPKKEKPPKEKDNTPPLPKGPVFMIWLMAGSLGALVMLGTNLMSYSDGVSSAKALYDSGSYTEAYQKIKGLEIKEKDVDLMGKVSTIASISSEYDSYVRYMNYGRQDLALDSLICSLGRCDLNLENAEKYDCLEEVKQFEKKIKKELKKSFKMSIEEARELYAIEDRNRYTVALKVKLTEMGLYEE